MSEPRTTHNSLKLLAEVAWRDWRQARWLLKRSVDVAYVGWVNRGNLGDEAIFRRQRSLLRGRSILPIPLDHRSMQLATATHPSAELMLLGGGTLLGRDGWERKVRAFQRRVNVGGLVVLGAGMEEPAFGKDRGVTTEAGMERWAAQLRNATYVGVRGPRTQRILAGMNVTSEVVGDPALTIPFPDLSAERHARKGDSRPLIAVNVASVIDSYTLGSHDHYRGLSLALEALKGSGARVRFFAMERADLTLARRVFTNFDDGAFPARSEGLEEVCGLIGSSSLVVSERLHGAIFAAGIGTPFLLLGYKPKCYDFAESIGYPGAVVPLESVADDEFINLAHRRAESVGLPTGVQSEIERLRGVFRAAHSTNVRR